MRTIKFKSKSARLLTAALSLLLLPAMAAHTGEIGARANDRAAPASQSHGTSRWFLISPRGESFTVRMPAVPRVYVTYEEGDEIRSQIGGQHVDRYHTYHAYHDGAVFLARFYKTSNPEKLLKGLLEEGHFRGSFVRDFRANGLAAKEYESRSESSYAKAHFVVSGNYLYWIEAGARDPGHPAVEAFLSTFKIGQPNSGGVSESAPTVDASAPAAPGVKPLTAKEVTRKAVLFYRAEPKYTIEARKQGTAGTVVIRLVLGADGGVPYIAVVDRLPNGLTEKAIEAAQHLRFLPAEKDGRKVSQYATIQYNFNVY